MTADYSVEFRNAGIDARVALVGPSPYICIFSGKKPKNTEEADPSGLLATIALPKAWMEKAKDGVAVKQGTWQATASAAGEAKCFRLYDKHGKCHIQGKVPDDMVLENPVFVLKQNVTVNLFAMQSGNAGG